jgi:adenosylhomocysteinase
VELTRSGVQFYENCEKPVFVADSGIVKRIETSLGTGEGYVRALLQLGYGSADAGGDGAAFAGKSFVVFGSGKVGQGIVLQLLREGAQVQVVTDKTRGVSPFLDANGVPVADCNDLKSVVALVSAADFVVTATGVKGALDRPELTAALLSSKAVLANMGVEDEYGSSVPAGRVLAEKKPLNFILEEPTHLKYIDASLALHGALGELLVREAADASDKKNAGPMDPPSELEQRILSMTMQDGLIGPEIAEMLSL